MVNDTSVSNGNVADTFVATAVGSPAVASVLLVDDQPAKLLAYEAVLSGLKVNCVRAHSGREALKQLLLQEFAVIVLDVSMPEMDGFETARLIREHHRLQHTPIIFVTGIHLSELDQLRGYEAGAIDYISVPVAPDILRTKIAVLVELHQRRTALEALNKSLAEARAKLESKQAASRSDHAAELSAIFDHPSHINTILQVERDAQGAVKDWRYRDANAVALRLLGLKREDLIGRFITEVPLTDRISVATEKYGEVLRHGGVARYEARHGSADYLVTAYRIDDDCIVASATDITDAKRIESALRRREGQLRESEERFRELEHELRQADAMKDEFLAMLSHELRNPTAAISNAAQALTQLLANEDTEQSLVTIVQRQVAHLSRLLDDLLDVARITQGRIELQREHVTLQQCVQAAIETTEPLMREKNQRLAVVQSSQPQWVFADRVRLTQCIANLLNNAAKYTNTGGEIRVRTFSENGHVGVEVIDCGVGIASDLLPRVFDLFVQGERPLDRSQGGLGIGLTVCRKLIEMHGGSITGKSDGAGLGATFTLRLPQASGPMRIIANANPSGSMQRVLIVDDNHDAADSLALLLQLQGHETLTVYSGDEALTRAVEFAPALALLDIGLPDIDGYEVARRLKNLLPTLKLLAVTGYGLLEDKVRSAAAGFDLHLVKPVALTDLDQAFARLQVG
jgi:signal transduction histidine kinase